MSRRDGGGVGGGAAGPTGPTGPAGPAPAGTGYVQVISGALQATVANTLDAQTAAHLVIGPTTATAVDLGAAAIPTNILGALVLAAGMSLSGLAGSGGLSCGSMTGATALPTGNLSWAGASTNTLSLVAQGVGGSATLDGTTLNLGTTQATAINIATSSINVTFGKGMILGAVGSSISQATTVSPTTFAIIAASSNSGNNKGGTVLLGGGAAHGTGLQGGVQLLMNNATCGLEITQVNTSGGRVLALCQNAINSGAGITTTNMPANTGDAVVFLANAVTAPTANAVGGLIQYATGGANTSRGTSGTVTTMAPA